MIDKILGAILGFGAASMFSKDKYAKGGSTYQGGGEIGFDEWWTSGGQGISEKKYTKDLENKFTNQKFVDEKVKEYYGASSVGDKDAENNTFWYVMEEMARKDKLHLKSVSAYQGG